MIGMFKKVKVLCIIIVAIIVMFVFEWSINTPTVNHGRFMLPNTTTPLLFENGTYTEVFEEQGTMFTTEYVIVSVIREGNDYFVWMQERPGGTGVFNYIALARYDKDEELFVSPKAIFLGDRINGVAITVRDGSIEVRFLNREIDEPYAVVPTKEVIHVFSYSDFGF